MEHVLRPLVHDVDDKDNDDNNIHFMISVGHWVWFSGRQKKINIEITKKNKEGSPNPLIKWVPEIQQPLNWKSRTGPKVNDI